MPIHSDDLESARLAINNILSQSYLNKEIIIVNDFSSNEVKNYLKTLDSSIFRVIHNKTNLGIEKTTNIALKNASGKLIFLFHDDDEYDIDRVSKIVDSYNKNPFDISSCNYITKSDNKFHKLPLDNRFIRLSLYFRNPICNPGVVFDGDTLRKFGFAYPSNAPAEDYLLWIRASKNKKITFSNYSESLLTYSDKESRTSLNIISNSIRREKLTVCMRELFHSNDLNLDEEALVNFTDFFHALRVLSFDEIKSIRETLLLIKSQNELLSKREVESVVCYYYSISMLRQNRAQIKSQGLTINILVSLFVNIFTLSYSITFMLLSKNQY